RQESNGIKLSTPDAAPALPEGTGKIEDEIAQLKPEAAAQAGSGPDQPEHIEVKSAYLKRLGEIVDLDAIRKAKLRVGFDPFWGAARGYSDELLRSAGIEVFAVHDSCDVLFGGHDAEPDDLWLGGMRYTMNAKHI